MLVPLMFAVELQALSRLVLSAYRPNLFNVFSPPKIDRVNGAMAASAFVTGIVSRSCELIQYKLLN